MPSKVNEFPEVKAAKSINGIRYLVNEYNYHKIGDDHSKLVGQLLLCLGDALRHILYLEQKLLEIGKLAKSDD